MDVIEDAWDALGEGVEFIGEITGINWLLDEIGDLFKPDMPNIGMSLGLTIKANAPKRHCYGEDVFGGNIIGYGKADISGKSYHVFHVLLVNHPCESVVIDSVNGKPAADYLDIIEQEIQLGDQTSASNLALEHCYNWTPQHIGYKQTCVTIKIEIDKERMPEGIQDIRWKVKGKRIYDPRKDSTIGGSGSHRANDESTWEWSDNSILCAYDNVRLEGYKEIPESRLSPADIMSGANACDEFVSFSQGGQDYSERRFTCNGLYEKTSAAPTVLSGIMKSCAGRVLRSGGKIYLRPGIYSGPSVLTLTLQDASGPIQYYPHPKINKRLNSVRASIIHPGKGWVGTALEPIVDSAHQASSGMVLDAEIDTPFVRSEGQAKRLCNQAMAQANAGSMTFPTKNKGFLLAIGTVVRVQIEERGIDKEFLIKSAEPGFDASGDWEMTMFLKEEATELYPDNFEPVVDEDTPNTTLPSAAVPDQVKNLTWTETPASNDHLGFITWETENNLFSDFEIELFNGETSLLKESVKDTQYFVNRQDADSAVISTINRFERKAAGVTVGISLTAPARPGSVFISATDLTWVHSNIQTVDFFKVNIIDHNAQTTRPLSVPVTPSDSIQRTSIAFLSAESQYTLQVVAVGKNGLESDASAVSKALALQPIEIIETEYDKEATGVNLLPLEHALPHDLLRPASSFDYVHKDDVVSVTYGTLRSWRMDMDNTEPSVVMLFDDDRFAGTMRLPKTNKVLYQFKIKSSIDLTIEVRFTTNGSTDFTIDQYNIVAGSDFTLISQNKEITTIDTYAAFTIEVEDVGATVYIADVMVEEQIGEATIPSPYVTPTADTKSTTKVSKTDDTDNSNVTPSSIGAGGLNETNTWQQDNNFTGGLRLNGQYLTDLLAAKDHEHTDVNNRLDSIENVLASDDVALDELQEIVNYVKLNRADLDALSIASVIGLQTKLDELDADLATTHWHLDTRQKITDFLVETRALFHQLDITYINGLQDELDAISNSLQSDDLNLDTRQKIVNFVNSLRTDVDSLTISSISGLESELNAIQTILASDDVALDELQEIVNYIKTNRSTLDSLSIGSILGLQTALDDKASLSQGNTFQAANIFNANAYFNQLARFGSTVELSDGRNLLSSLQGIDSSLVSVNASLSSNDVNLSSRQQIVDYAKLIRSDVDSLSISSINGLETKLDSIDSVLASDDVNLDELQEIVNYIKANRTDLDSLGINSIIGLNTALDNINTSIGDNVTSINDLYTIKANLSASNNWGARQGFLGGAYVSDLASDAALTPTNGLFVKGDVKSNGAINAVGGLKENNIALSVKYFARDALTYDGETTYDAAFTAVQEFRDWVSSGDADTSAYSTVTPSIATGVVNTTFAMANQVIADGGTFEYLNGKCIEAGTVTAEEINITEVELYSGILDESWGWVSSLANNSFTSNFDPSTQYTKNHLITEDYGDNVPNYYINDYYSWNYGGSVENYISTPKFDIEGHKMVSITIDAIAYKGRDFDESHIIFYDDSGNVITTNLTQYVSPHCLSKLTGSYTSGLDAFQDNVTNNRSLLKASMFLRQVGVNALPSREMVDAANNYNQDSDNFKFGMIEIPAGAKYVAWLFKTSTSTSQPEFVPRTYTVATHLNAALTSSSANIGTATIGLQNTDTLVLSTDLADLNAPAFRKSTVGVGFQVSDIDVSTYSSGFQIVRNLESVAFSNPSSDADADFTFNKPIKVNNDLVLTEASAVITQMQQDIAALQSQ